MRSILRQESGLTIIEILVSVVIFMIGFSTVIALLDSSLVKFSTRELVLADNVSDEIMTMTIAFQDTTSLDTLVTRSQLHFRVRRGIELDGSLARVILSVSRERTNKKIVELYSVFRVREE